MEKKKKIIEGYIHTKGITLSEFARRAGVSRQLINLHIHNPKTKMSPPIASRIAKYIADGKEDEYRIFMIMMGC